ncbi:nucleoside diphosphate kinase regulator [Bremerella cremea]|uniref:nucleoside diphosphate kinase regulator n=1 Tax=Bremerella cremea TaxID=1031537 RepID=UPI0018F5D05A|nr:nucleoside diphosphate kinase regulator [Bremerella cremea]
MASKKKNNKKIVLTAGDYRRLVSLLNDSFALAIADKPYLKNLRSELDAAEIVDARLIPKDVVTMNSTVHLRELSSNELDTFTLVFPKDANIVEGKLSVLAPVGTAILGQKIGDVVTWPALSGRVKVEIEEVIVPEVQSEITTWL